MTDADIPSGAAASRVGQVIGGRYSVERLLGEGDRKQTYLAQDTKFRDRRVALSVMKPDAVARDPGGTQREADVLTSIGPHNHIVRLHDAVTEGELQYIVAEYLDRGTLADLVTGRQEQSEPLSGEEILTFARQLAKALSHVHKHGVIHRDVSPHNVWLDERGKGHLGDFDSAIFADAQEGFNLATARQFASPEDVEGRHLDARSDLYSLGRVIAFLAIGELGDEKARIHTRSKRPDLPSALHALVDQLVAEDPDGRYPSADAVLRDLQEALSQLDQPSVLSSYPYPIARAARLHANAERDPRTRFESALSVGENLIIMLAAIGLSWNRGATHRTDGVRMWSLSLTRGGITLGVWLAVARDAAVAGRQASDGIFGLTDALVPERGRQRLLGALDVVVNVRNRWAHDGIVRSELDVARRLAELEPALAIALDQSAFLASARLILVQRSSRRRGVHGFSNRGLLLMGDNSVFKPVEFKSEQPLTEDSIYLLNQDSSHMLDLSPFYLAHECTTCGNLEIFYPNRMTPSRDAIMMKSTDTPHEFRDEALVPEFVAFAADTMSGLT
jgi:hypothetical protein